MRILPILIFAAITLQCSTSPTSPKLGVIAVSVYSVGIGSPVGGVKVDLLQTNETKLTDSTGVAAFVVNPGAYTVRVHDLQSGGPALHTIDSTISVSAGQVDSLKFGDCLICF